MILVEIQANIFYVGLNSEKENGFPDDLANKELAGEDGEDIYLMAGDHLET